jgi:hypothetical protein
LRKKNVFILISVEPWIVAKGQNSPVAVSEVFESKNI